MNAIAFSMVYVAFFGMIAFLGWWFDSAWVMIALLFMPSIKMKTGSKKDKPKKESQITPGL